MKNVNSKTYNTLITRTGLNYSSSQLKILLVTEYPSWKLIDFQTFPSIYNIFMSVQTSVISQNIWCNT